MSRKQASFGQLIGYIDREPIPDAYRIRHNLLARDPQRVREEFEANASLLQARKNGVYLYHEILSITRAQGLSDEQQKQRLYHIAQEYIAARCPDNLVYGGLHQDKAHSFHFHLIISANRAGDTKRLRLARSEFRSIQVELEARVLREQPELEQTIAIGKRSDRRRSRPETQVEASGVQNLTVLERARQATQNAVQHESLVAALQEQGLELYVRGKQLGVIDLRDGSKHRLKTLDPDLHATCEARIEAGQVQGENEAPAGENKKGAEALPSSHQEPEPQPEPLVVQQDILEPQSLSLSAVQEQWTQQIEALRHRTEERVHEAEGRQRLRDITAMVKLAVQGTLLGLKTRYLHLLQHLQRRRPNHETSHLKFTKATATPTDERHR